MYPVTIKRFHLKGSQCKTAATMMRLILLTGNYLFLTLYIKYFAIDMIFEICIMRVLTHLNLNSAFFIFYFTVQAFACYLFILVSFLYALFLK